MGWWSLLLLLTLWSSFPTHECYSYRIGRCSCEVVTNYIRVVCSGSDLTRVPSLPPSTAQHTYILALARNKIRRVTASDFAMYPRLRILDVRQQVGIDCTSVSSLGQPSELVVKGECLTCHYILHE